MNRSESTQINTNQHDSTLFCIIYSLILYV